MDTIILIETSTGLCSTAMARDGKIISYKESTEPRSHASLTAVFIKEMLDETGIGPAECNAVCVSMGPGSYTGLRVGVSTAKGLCFGAGIPLLAVGTLDTLVWQAKSEGLIPEGCRYIIPMIDARRMEVYTAVFSADGRQLMETAPLIVSEDSFGNYLDQGPVLFIGDGAGKTGARAHRRHQVHPMLPESIVNARTCHDRVQRKTVQRRCVLRTVLSEGIRCDRKPQISSGKIAWVYFNRRAIAFLRDEASAMLPSIISPSEITKETGSLSRLYRTSEDEPAPRPSHTLIQPRS